MRLTIFSLFALLACIAGFSQDYSNQWEGHYSYLNITGISNSSNGVSVAAQNAIYNLDSSTQNFQTTSTINGMSGNTISTYHYSITYDISVIGYENGLLEIVNNQNQVTTVVDIVEEANVSQNLKKINHLYEFNNLVYISTDYGISVYDLENLEFRDTYFIGSGGAQNPIAVEQVTILGDYVYAATTSNGIKRALYADPNIIDFSLWTTITNASLSNWKSIVTHNNSVYGLTNGDVLYNYDQVSFNNILNIPSTVLEHRTVNDLMVFTSSNTVWAYDNNLNITYTIPFLIEYESNFTHTTIKDNFAYIGTESNGVLVIDLSSITLSNNIKPNGPLDNNIFAIRSNNTQAWVVYGDHTQFFNPGPLNRSGISHLENNNWNNINYNDVLGAVNLVDIAINPFNQNQVFISSYRSGLLDVTNDIPTVLYSESNSGLVSLSEIFGGSNIDIRVGRSAFDRNGKLWLTNNLTSQPLKAFDVSNNSWEAHNLAPIISTTSPQNDEIGFSELVIDQNNTKWIGGYRKGVIGFNENNGIKNIDLATGNLPDNAVRGLALDKDSNLWIGTEQGLRVLYNTGNFFNIANPQAQSIIFLDSDGIAKELMFGQYITDIEVDGSNNKWIATFDSGVFYVSPDGQETIYHFTKDNSPLPTNNITDMSIDSSTGVVYFSTPNGLVAFKGLSKEPSNNLENIIVYPNPVRPQMVKNLLGFSPTDIGKGIKIEGLTENVNIKITDVSGNLVSDANTSTQSGNLSINEGGFAIWNGKNFNNNIVATGVYFIMITDLDSQETTIEKVMIVK